ncbi:hypothetical protein DMC25_21540 [Caulobacter sp. D4A]|uniref:DUF2946 family protein n=1 Tax=unclassified Caulobacter TaxID=2648921 RepID=UPI000D73EBF0|nr:MULTISPECIES: DUF2946 family protein [unclassified Caulobacter]PXA79884.1 hypothetical protein DMC25_21540 [Caulobacter sp. D4A]PXA94865.1 hypothetical protein DMC18_05380 [Caulobacter sp. D5]
MTRPTTLARWLARDAFMALAVLAIVLKVLIPAGFMPGAEPRNGLPFALVLCTADGAKTVSPGALLDTHQSDQRHDQNDGKQQHHDGPCPFAAQGPAAPPVEVALAAETLVAIETEAPSALARTVAPGRGLAAPPPPATGPPSLLI